MAVVDDQQARPSLVCQTLALVSPVGPAHVHDLVVGLPWRTAVLMTVLLTGCRGR